LEVADTSGGAHMPGSRRGWAIRISLIFIGYFLCLAVLPGIAGTTDQTFTRQAMLKSMAQNCIVPGIIDIATNADELCNTTRDLMHKPSDQTLVQAQQAWAKLDSAYRRNKMLTYYGPIGDQVFWKANFYQSTSPSIVEYLIGSDRLLDDNWVQRVGATGKGFSAIQYLLFGKATGRSETNSFASWLLEGSNAPRRRLYLWLIAKDLDRNMQKTALKVQDTNFPNAFAAGGQASANLLVNQLILSLELNLAFPLKIVLSPAFAKQNTGGRAVSNMEALSDMKTTVRGLHRFYVGEDGTGLGDFVREINPGLADRLELQFQATSQAWAALNQPLEMMILSQRATLEKADEQTRKLEMLLRVDLVSTMGVTIMFNSYDGD
jgi:predicted lipoprotein